MSSYRYLGILFSASGSFSLTKNELYKKALKGYYKLRKYLISLNPGIEPSLHVFDHTIKPILLYASEIWGSFNVNNQKIRSPNPGDLNLDLCYKNLPCEQLHMKFCKFILGVHRKSVNFGSLSELGRFPLHYNIVKSMLKYCYRLQNLTEFPLLSDAFAYSKDSHYQGKTTWYSSIQKLLKILNINEDFLSCDKRKFNFILNKTLRNKYLKDWKNNCEKFKAGKLDTYLSIKKHFGPEKYLNIIKNFQYRKAFCRFRISSHRLFIETGRYKKIPRENRICHNCGKNEVENELHFLIQCDKYHNERKQLFDIISKTANNFTRLNEEEKFFYILNNENKDILYYLCNFLHDHLP